MLSAFFLPASIPPLRPIPQVVSGESESSLTPSQELELVKSLRRISVPTFTLAKTSMLLEHGSSTMGSLYHDLSTCYLARDKVIQDLLGGWQCREVILISDIDIRNPGDAPSFICSSH